ncbi:MFS family permease [Microbacterium resistens]|uniref:MFS family permease n=1 Tax=Microbacterium resistens TaxID=156977 RepID=A0ABU1S818_9MICO|nr:MFS transporter [Microbacterium resistens]MDR6865680.1 MFS family permease [Microbacterium resistens]
MNESVRQAVDGPREGRTVRPWKIAAATLIGVSIEWFDYGIYGFAAAVVFPTAFFPELDPAVAILASFATLAVGSLGRPFGALLFGHIGDRYGRRRSMVLSLTLMGAMTVAVGLLPTYAQIGALAPILLLLVRIAQSLAVGGEWGSALLFAVESAPPERRAFFGSFTQMGSGLGAFMTAGAFSLIGLLGDQAVLEWAWRLPFLASIVLIVLGLLIRTQLPETEVFTEDEQIEETRKRPPILALLKDHWAVALLSIGAFLVPVSGYYIVGSFFASYATGTLGLSTGAIASAGLLSSLVSIVATPIAAILADRIGVRRMTVIGLALHLVIALPIFLLLDQGTVLAFTLAGALGMLISTLAYSTVGTLVAGWYPTGVRQTGVSLTYQITGVIGGLMPALSQTLSIAGHGGWALVALLFAAMSAISLVSVLLKRSAGYLDLKGSNSIGTIAPAVQGEGLA